MAELKEGDRVPEGGEPVAGNHSELEFEVDVERGEQALGIDVIHQDPQHLFISRVNVGPLLLWNRLHPGKAVRPGDRIVTVNGQSGASDVLVEHVRASQSLRMGIKRILQFTVTVPKTAKLGLEVAQEEGSLRMLHIGPGPFLDWNSKAGLDQQVRQGDHLVEANGVRGTAPELLVSIRSSVDTVEVVMRRGKDTGPLRRATRLSASMLASAQAALAPPAQEAASEHEAALLQPAQEVASEDEAERPPRDGFCAITIGA